MEDALDLASLYVSVQEVSACLGSSGLSQAEVDMGILAWRDAPRAARSSTPTPVVAQTAVAVVVAPRRGRCKRPPPAINAPGIWHTRWATALKRKMAHARQLQGLQVAEKASLEEIWCIFQRAAERSSMWKKQEDEKKHDMFKQLFLRPFERFADSLEARLAPWRRWRHGC